MTLERIRKAARRQPFQPFFLHLADGQVVRVPHPDCIAFDEHGVAVILPDDDHILDMGQIVSIRYPRTPRRA